MSTQCTYATVWTGPPAQEEGHLISFHIWFIFGKVHPPPQAVSAFPLLYTLPSSFHERVCSSVKLQAALSLRFHNHPPSPCMGDLYVEKNYIDNSP